MGTLGACVDASTIGVCDASGTGIRTDAGEDTASDSDALLTPSLDTILS